MKKYFVYYNFGLFFTSNATLTGSSIIELEEVTIKEVRQKIKTELETKYRRNIEDATIDGIFVGTIMQINAL